MRIFKWIGITVAALLGLTLIAAVVLIALFDPNDYKDELTAAIEERTGRRIEIADPIEWSLFPWLAIETGGITVGNHADFGDAPFATIESLSARVRVWPLLRREVELGLITLEGISLDVGTNAAGVANWSDLTGAEQADASAAPAAPAGGNAIVELEIAGVRIVDGRLLWRERGEVRYVVSEAELTTGSIALGEPVDFTAALTVLDVASQRRAELDLSAIAALDGDDWRIEDLELETTVVDAAGNRRGTATLATELLTYAGGERLTAAAGSIDASTEDPPFGGGPLDGRIEWPSFEVDIASGAARIDDVTTAVNGLSATWTLTVANLDDAPSVRGEVDIERAPAAQFLAVAGIEPPANLDPAELGEVAGRGGFRATSDGAVAVDGFVVELLGLAVRVTADRAANGALDARVVVPSFPPGPQFRGIAAGRLPIEPDWEAIDALGLDAAVAIAADATAPIDFRLNQATIGGVSLNGRVSIGRAAGGRYSGALTAAAPNPATLAALLGERFPSNMDASAIGAAAFTANFDYDAAADTLVVDDVSASAFGLAAGGNVTFNSLSTAPVARGRATLARFDPAALLERLDQPRPQASDPSAFRAAAFTGNFIVDAAHAEFRGIALTLDDSRITGDVSVEDFASPRYRFDLATDTLDVDRYLPPPAEATADGERAAGDIALANEPLERLDLVGTARVGALKLAGLDFQRVEATMTIGEGRASIEPARTELYGGTFDGAFAVDTTGDTPTMRLEGQAATIALAPLVTALTGESNVRGTASFDMDLTGTGGTVTEALRTAAGRMGFAINAGAIDGFNLGRTLCAGYNLREQLPQPAQAPAITEFELIRASADVRDGVATTEDMLGRTGFMEVTGSGGMNLADATVEYVMTATLTAAVPIRGCETMTEFVGDSIPFTIEGPLSSPSIEPDYREIVRSRVQEEIRDRVEDRLRERLRDLL